MNRILALLCVGLLLPVASAGVPPLTLADLCHDATRIVRGVVKGSSTRWEGSMIVTDWEIEPLANYKGEGTKTFKVKVPGGRLAGLVMRAGEAPRLRAGEEVILFLRPGVGACDVFGWFRGKYTVAGGRIREKSGVTLKAFEAAIRKWVSAATEGGKGR